MKFLAFLVLLFPLVASAQSTEASWCKWSVPPECSSGGVGVSVDLTSEVTGTLPIANGGTGATSATGDRLLETNAGGTAYQASSITKSGSDYTFPGDIAAGNLHNDHGTLSGREDNDHLQYPLRTANTTAPASQNCTTVGEMHRDTDSAAPLLWYTCTVAGTPGTWKPIGESILAWANFNENSAGVANEHVPWGNETGGTNGIPSMCRCVNQAVTLTMFEGTVTAPLTTTEGVDIVLMLGDDCASMSAVSGAELLGGSATFRAIYDVESDPIIQPVAAGQCIAIRLEEPTNTSQCASGAGCTWTGSVSAFNLNVWGVR